MLGWRRNTASQEELPAQDGAAQSTSAEASEVLQDPTGQRPEPLNPEVKEFMKSPSSQHPLAKSPVFQQAQHVNTNVYGSKAGPKPYLGKHTISWPAKVTGVGRRTTIRDILRALAAFDLEERDVRYRTPPVSDSRHV